MSDLKLTVLRLTDFADPDRREGFVSSLGAALEEWGFVAITDHGIPAELLAQSYDTAAEFFTCPSPYKRSFERPDEGRQRGYTGFGVEHAKDQSVHDLKEFWQVGRNLGPEHPLVTSGQMPDNLFPPQPENFGATFTTLFSALDHVANTMLEAIALHIGYDADALLGGVQDGNSVLRVIHYPPLRDSDPKDAVRAAAHEDINLLTVLPASTQPGLQLLDKTGQWRSLVTPPDVMIVDTGDLMQHLSGGQLPSVTHRVVNPSGNTNVSRYSMPFFVHPRPEWLITPMKGDGAPITAGAYLTQRLREIGVL